MKRVNNAQPNCTGQAVDVRRRKQIKLLRPINRPHLENILPVYFLQHSVSIGPRKDQSYIRTIHTRMRSNQDIQSFSFLKSPDTNDVFLCVNSKFIEDGLPALGGKSFI